jgi:hypothetical protein
MTILGMGVSKPVIAVVQVLVPGFDLPSAGVNFQGANSNSNDVGVRRKAKTSYVLSSISTAPFISVAVFSADGGVSTNIRSHKSED